MTSRLQLAPGIKAGARFEADQVLAYDPNFFAPHAEGGVTAKVGVLVRAAFAALDQTYEDSMVVTERLTRLTAADVTMMRTVSLGPKANLQKCARVGDVVDPNTPLAVFENVSDDLDVAGLLQRVGAEFDEAIADLAKNQALAKYAGRVVELRVFFNREPEELSPSLQALLRRLTRAAAARQKAASTSARDEPIRVAAPERVRRDKVLGEPIDGVLLAYFIQVEDVAAPGDKYTLASPLKGIVSRVLEPGEEPTSEDGRQVDLIVTPMSLVSRMTVDAFLLLWSNAVMVGLKERCLAVLDE